MRLVTEDEVFTYGEDDLYDRVENITKTRKWCVVWEGRRLTKTLFNLSSKIGGVTILT